MIKSITTILLFFVLSGHLLGQTKDRLPCVDKEFSVVAHIFLDSLGNKHITEAEINTYFAEASVYFAPICVSFKVCEFRYHPEFEYDEHHSAMEWKELQTLYHQKNCINVYYIYYMTDPYPYCSYSGVGAVADMLTSGTVIAKACLLPGSMIHAHEMGHILGLEDTYEKKYGLELVDGSNCATAGDKICDTPADPFIPNDNHVYRDQDCHFVSNKKDANGQYYDPLVGNIMSGYDCKCSFTHQQLMKMANFYLDHKGMW